MCYEQFAFSDILLRAISCLPYLVISQVTRHVSLLVFFLGRFPGRHIPLKRLRPQEHLPGCHWCYERPFAPIGIDDIVSEQGSLQKGATIEDDRTQLAPSY